MSGQGPIGPPFHMENLTSVQRICAYCKQHISEEDLKVERKYEEIGGYSFPFIRVWHRQCENEWLEQGES